MLMRVSRQGFGTALAVMVLAAGCGGRLRSPQQLSPVGDTAFYARRAIHAINELQIVAIEGEKAGVIKTDDARRIITATKTAGEAGVALSEALKAGASETSARKQALAVIRKALEELPEYLSDQGRQITEPYIQTVLLLLSVFE
jgi:CTP:molybdopterin cytidylyltransferase MocA